jgi:hypothetical protein
MLQSPRKHQSANLSDIFLHDALAMTIVAFSHATRPDTQHGDPITATSDSNWASVARTRPKCRDQQKIC